MTDERSGSPTVDGLHSGSGALPTGQIYVLPVAGRGGVPVDASAVEMNIVAVSPSGNGYLTVWPCGTSRPLASILSFRTATTIANSFTAQVGAAGSVCIYTSMTTHLVADIGGYHPHTASYQPLTPTSERLALAAGVRAR